MSYSLSSMTIFLSIVFSVYPTNSLFQFLFVLHTPSYSLIFFFIVLQFFHLAVAICFKFAHISICLVYFIKCNPTIDNDCITCIYSPAHIHFYMPNAILFLSILCLNISLCLLSGENRHNWFWLRIPRGRVINKTRGGATCDIPPTPTPAPCSFCISRLWFQALRGVFPCACAVLRAVLCYNVLYSCAFACLGNSKHKTQIKV